MPVLRIVAVLHALSLIIGESIRSFGQGRPAAFWLDDMLMGGFLIAAARAMRRDTPRNRAAFAAAWGTNAGMLYGSFFGKVFDPARANPGNIELGLLTVLIGIAFTVSVAGMFAAILLPQSRN